MSARFPWDEFMRLGLGVLKLSPAAFWKATPREIAAAFPKKTQAALARPVLETLMQRFPDVT
jgi:uncharacterized phage protein (TIGR02216 family)